LFDGVEVLNLTFWVKAKSDLREIITSCKGKRDHKVAKVTYPVVLGSVARVGLKDHRPCAEGFKGVRN